MVAQYEEKYTTTTYASESESNNAAGHHHYGSISENNSNTYGNGNGATNNNNLERKPLVLDTNSGDDDDENTCTSSNRLLQEKDLLQDEISGMAKLAIPVILTYLLEQLPGIVTIILVGRVESSIYDEEETSSSSGTTMSMQKLHLDAASLAVMFTNVVALSPAYGILTAMDTLCSQAYGADQSHKMGTYTLTGLLVISIVFLGSSLLIWNASSILISLGQPIEVSIMAGDFIRWYLPGVPFLYVYELIRKVFQSRNDAMPMLVAAVVCNVVNVSVGYYLVHWTEWGWMGASVARSVGNFVTIPTMLMGMMMGRKGGRASVEISNGGCTTVLPINKGDECDTQQYLEVDGGNNTMETSRDGKVERNDNDSSDDLLNHLWEGFVISEALSAKAIIEFLTLGLPGMLQLMFEWCAFESISLIAGILPGREAIIGIGANSITMNVSSMGYMLYLGVSISGNVRVGNALGAGDVHRAEIAAKLTLASGAIMSIINIAFLLSFRKILPWFFTTDSDIAEKAQHLFLIAAAFQLPDAIHSGVQGIFRGSGRQALAAMYNFVAFYIIGIPLGYVLGVKLGFGVEGLWCGITAGLCTIAIGCTIIVFRSDWSKLSLEATSRLNR